MFHRSKGLFNRRKERAMIVRVMAIALLALTSGIGSGAQENNLAKPPIMYQVQQTVTKIDFAALLSPSHKKSRPTYQQAVLNSNECHSTGCKRSNTSRLCPAPKTCTCSCDRDGHGWCTDCS
jgi:hypothetical protein